MESTRQPATYIMGNKPNGTLYTGVSAQFSRRVYQNRGNKDGSVFCKRYKIDKLYYYEFHPTMPQAIAREKQIKAGSRADKLKLIESINPTWQDLYSHTLN